MEYDVGYQQLCFLPCYMYLAGGTIVGSGIRSKLHHSASAGEPRVMIPRFPCTGSKLVSWLAFPASGTHRSGSPMNPQGWELWSADWHSQSQRLTRVLDSSVLLRLGVLMPASGILMTMTLMYPWGWDFCPLFNSGSSESRALVHLWGGSSSLVDLCFQPHGVHQSKGLQCTPILVALTSWFTRLRIKHNVQWEPAKKLLHTFCLITL